EELEDWLELRPLDPIYRLTLHDRSRLDVVPGAGGMGAGRERAPRPGRGGRRVGAAAAPRRRPAATWPSVTAWAGCWRPSGGRSSTATTTALPTWPGRWNCCGWPAWAASGGCTTWSPPTPPHVGSPAPPPAPRATH